MRVAVVCKDVLMRDGLLSLLSHEGAFDVSPGVDRVSEVPPPSEEGSSVLVVVADGLDAEDWLQLNAARSDETTHIVLLVSSATSTAGHKVAHAIIRRSEGSVALIQAVRRFLGPVLYKANTGEAAGLVREPLAIYGAPRSLTRRELEVAQLVAQGMPNRRIAAMLKLREQSVKNLVSGVMRKLDCENRVQVALRLAGRPSVSSRRSY